jgi:acyl-CoA thioester hydrolase
MAVPRHVTRSRVAWIDTDAGGRIHFTAAFRWAEAAETALLRSLGLLDGWADFPRLELGPECVGMNSITYGWEIRRGDGGVCIRGRHTAVHVDADGRPAPLSPTMRHALEGAPS